MKKNVPENQKTRPDLDDQAWIVWLSMQRENRGIEVAALYRDMLAWCLKKGKTPTRLRLLKWLEGERENLPMTYEPAYFAPPSEPQAASLPAAKQAERPDCKVCKNERFVETVVDPTAEFEWARVRMLPCKACSPEATNAD